MHPVAVLVSMISMQCNNDRSLRAEWRERGREEFFSDNRSLSDEPLELVAAFLAYFAFDGGRLDFPAALMIVPRFLKEMGLHPFDTAGFARQIQSMDMAPEGLRDRVLTILESSCP